MNNINGVTNYNLFVNEQLLLKNLNFVSDKHICLLGASGSGKSLLLKEFKQSSNFANSSFYLDEREKIDDWQSYFSYEKLDEEKQLFLRKLYSSKENIEIKNALVKKIFEHKSTIFCEQLPFTKEEFETLITYLNQNNQKIFYVTNDIEDVIYFDYLIIIKNGQVIIEGKKDLVLQEEKLLKSMGFSLPFYINMSIQLGYYQILNTLCAEKKELGERICR